MSEIAAANPATPARGSGLPASLRIAFRDLRAGLSGFGVFLACLAIGVAAITGIGSIASALMDGLEREGRTILGGDLAFSLIQREATEAELAAISRHGRVSSIATMRGMARLADGRGALVEVKAVDKAYPSIGTLTTEPALPAAELFGEREGRFGAAVDRALLARLDLKVGDTINLGRSTFDIRAVVQQEPDRIAVGIGFGPRFLASQDGLRATGLWQPGALVRWTYRVVMDESADAARLDAAAEAVKAATPEAGWAVRTRLAASPEIGRNVGRFTQFLALVALTALVVGGVGVANAVRGFVDRKRATIAILKSLGASGERVFLICLTEVLALTALGVVIGLAAGAALPFLVAATVGQLLPMPFEPSIHPRDLGLGALYGFATALAFALWPLGRAHDVPVSSLFRDGVTPEARWPRRRYLVAEAVAVVVLVAVAIGLAWDRYVAGIAVAATAATFVLLRLVASGLMALAARLPRPRRVELRLALANAHRPGALTPSLVMSLGLGVALVVALGQIDGNIRRELVRSIPEKAPSFFFLDIPSTETAAFDSLVAKQAPEARLERVPMMRGRLVSIKGVPVERISAPDRFSWVLEGDRGITYADQPPPGSRVVEGAWWPAGHTGTRLVSFDAEIGKALGLAVGDTIVVNVLGRNLEATIANLRVVDWRTFGINFVMVFSPNSFRGAPHMHLATATFPGGATDTREQALVRTVGEAYPAVTAVRVKDQLEAVDRLLSQLVAAIRGASGIALTVSLLVLAGALAAGQRARLYDAVVLKTLGATRGRLVFAFALEYSLLGAVTAVFGVLSGMLVAYAIVEFVMRLPFAPLALEAAATAILAIVVTIFLGLIGTWRILGEKVAPRLRNL